MFLQCTQTGKMMITVDSDKVCIYNVIFRTIAKKYRGIGLKPLHVNQSGIIKTCNFSIKMCNFSTKRQEKEISETKTKTTNRKQPKKESY